MVPRLKSAIRRRDTPHSNCTHACEARGAVLARGAVARGAVARGAVRGVPCAGCRGGVRRGTQKFKMDVQWLPIVLSCCADVVELNLSFKTRIRLSHNSSGRPSCGPDTVLEKNLLFFDQFSVFFGRRGRPLEPDTQTGKRKTCDFIIQIFI